MAFRSHCMPKINSTAPTSRRKHVDWKVNQRGTDERDERAQREQRHRRAFQG